MGTIDLSSFAGQRFYVVGLGLSGLNAANALQSAGAILTVWDDRAIPEQWAPMAVSPDGVNYRDLAALILAPGIALTHRTAQQARDHGIDIISDIELAFRAGIQAKTIGITGTNGKSTTTALVDHILRTLGADSVIGGNFGRPILDCADPGPKGFIVLELSSYQLDLSPEGYPLSSACILNISPDHLDRHGDMIAYANAKAKIFTRAQHRIVTGIDPHSLAIAKSVETNILSQEHWCEFPETTLLRGIHNQQNQAAACGLLQPFGFDRHDIIAAIQSFPGVSHRQEILGTAGPWTFVNDSKATNVDSAARALNAFDHIHWLAGGRGKDGGVSGLIPVLGKVEQAYLYGENRAELAQLCQDQNVPYQQFETLDQAVTQALKTKKGGTLLLSPAAASWDQYTSFERRGDHFRDLFSQYLHTQGVPA